MDFDGGFSVSFGDSLIVLCMLGYNQHLYAFVSLAPASKGAVKINSFMCQFDTVPLQKQFRS